jgi:hypothetical protein
MGDTKTLINDDKGNLTDIVALANDSSKGIINADNSIVIEGANEKGSIHEFVQNELNDSSDDTQLEEPPTSDTKEEEKLPEKAATEVKPSDDEKEEVVPDKTPAEKQEDERIEKLVNERFDKHPRFQELNSKVQELTPLAENAKLDAQFCQQYNIVPEQKKTAMELCAMVNANPEQALAALEKLVENIKLSTGKLLPKDLTEEVEAGTMSKERASELHMARMKLAAKEQQATQTQDSFVRQHDQQIRSAISAAGDMIAKTNPDFRPKQPGQKDGVYELTVDKMKLLAMEKYPTNTTEASKLLQDAYNYAKSIFVLPQPPRARRVLRSTDTISSRNNGDETPKNGETMAQYISRTTGKRYGFNLNGE